MKLGPNLTVMSVTIANGASLSNTIDTLGFPLVGILMPAAWTAADITLKAAPDAAANVASVYDEAGTEINLKGAASQLIAIPLTKLTGLRYVQVRSGTAALAVNQAANRVLGLVVREL